MSPHILATSGEPAIICGQHGPDLLTRAFWQAHRAAEESSSCLFQASLCLEEIPCKAQHVLGKHMVAVVAGEWGIWRSALMFQPQKKEREVLMLTSHWDSKESYSPIP